MVVDDCRAVSRGAGDSCYSKTVRIDVVNVGVERALSERLSPRVAVEDCGGAFLALDPPAETVVGVIALDAATVARAEQLSLDVPLVRPVSTGRCGSPGEKPTIRVVAVTVCYTTTSRTGKLAVRLGD